MFWYVEQLSMTAVRFNTGGPSSCHESGRDSCSRAVLCYKINLPYCFVVFFVVCSRLRPF